ncbi:hypothetical protein VTO42DRAFT_8247 [Malbranchea cinnamomea]
MYSSGWMLFTSAQDTHFCDPFTPSSIIIDPFTSLDTIDRAQRRETEQNVKKGKVHEQRNTERDKRRWTELNVCSTQNKAPPLGLHAENSKTGQMQTVCVRYYVADRCPSTAQMPNQIHYPRP